MSVCLSVQYRLRYTKIIHVNRRIHTDKMASGVRQSVRCAQNIPSLRIRPLRTPLPAIGQHQHMTDILSPGLAFDPLIQRAFPVIRVGRSGVISLKDVGQWTGEIVVQTQNLLTGIQSHSLRSYD